MRKNIFTNLFAASMLVLGANAAMAQCPGCTINLPADVLAVVDTVHLDTFAEAQKNVYYEQQLSFRLSQTTTPLAALQPGTPGGIDINSWTIDNVVGLPVGMNYLTDRVPALYDDAAPTPRDGCVNVCGTPSQAGLFDVIINITVNVPVLGDQPAQIPLQLLVLPDSSAGFTASSYSGCEPLTVTFTNNVASNGDPGVTYSWDFGNGQTSTLESPDSVIYQTAGAYVVQYQAIVDTFPYTLRRVIALSTDCNDDIPLISQGAPDLYIILEDGSGTELINTDYGAFLDDGRNMYAPDTIWLGSYDLDLAETYTLRVRDDDPLGDDDCGSYVFTANTVQTVFTNNPHSADIWIEHYVDTVTTVDTIFVNDCTSIDEIFDVNKTLMVYPNPTSNDVNVTFHWPGTPLETELMVTDMLGRTIIRKDLGAHTGTYNEMLNLREFGTGIYVLQLRMGDKVSVRKIVVE